MAHINKNGKHLLLTISVMVVFSLCLYSADKYVPHVNPTKCVGCYDCELYCPKGGRAIAVINGKAIVNVDECIGCKNCMYICSYGAVY